MDRVIHLVYGDEKFVLEMSVLQRMRKITEVERVATHNSLTYSFPSLERYCIQKGIQFERGISPGNFSVNGEGFYLASLSDLPEVIENFERRGFRLSKESITLENSFLQ